MTVTSETPWRSFTIRPGGDAIAPHLPHSTQSQPTSVPEASIAYLSLTASPNGDLYMFGGFPKERGLFRLDLDTHNSVAIIRNVQAAGVCPSLRNAHSAIWIGSSLMLVWGGYDTLPRDYSDVDIHIFNASKSCCWLSACRLSRCLCLAPHHQRYPHLDNSYHVRTISEPQI